MKSASCFNLKMLSFVLLFFVVSQNETLVVLASSPPPEPPERARRVTLNEFAAKELESPAGLAMFQNRYYITDERMNQVLVFDTKGGLLRTIGSAGSGKGELLRPSTIIVAKDGTIYVRDFGNERIQVFDPRGEYAGEVKAPDFTGFAVNPKGYILMGRPENGALVSIYDRSGQEVGKIGKLRKTSDFYGAAARADDYRNRMLINRVDISFGEDGEMYLTFLFAPIVQKYSPQGKLIWERRLSGPHIDRLTQLFVSDEGRTGHKFVRIVMDGRAANFVTTACAFDPVTHRLYVLLPGRQLAVLGADGRTVDFLALHPSSNDKAPSPLAIGSAFRNVLMLVDPFTRTIWRGDVVR